jgi:hypothetical protein
MESLGGFANQGTSKLAGNAFDNIKPKVESNFGDGWDVPVMGTKALASGILGQISNNLVTRAPLFDGIISWDNDVNMGVSLLLDLIKPFQK